MTSGWDCLPASCWLEIVKNLDLDGKTTCRQVSKQWSSCTSVAIHAVIISIPDTSLSKDDLQATIARIRSCYPCFSHIHLRLDSKVSTYGSFKHLLRTMATSPLLHAVQELTISSAALQTIPIPLSPLENLTSLCHLNLQTLYNTYAMSDLTTHLTNLSALSFNLQHLSTTPTDNTYKHTLLPLCSSLASLDAHLAYSTTDQTLATIAQLTNLRHLAINCSRHFATTSGIIGLSSLTALNSFHIMNFAFFTIPHGLINPLSQNSTPASFTMEPPWLSTWSTLLNAWSNLEELHVTETNLQPDLFTALAAVMPPSLKRLHLTLKFTSDGRPASREMVQVLSKVPQVHLELHPHAQHDLELYGGILYGCSSLQSLRLVGVPLSPYTVKLLEPCTSLKHLHIHFCNPTTNGKPSVMLTSALLGSLAMLLHLTSCHITAIPVLSHSLAALASDAGVGALVSHLPLQSVVVATHRSTDFEQWSTGRIVGESVLMSSEQLAQVAEYHGVAALAARPGMREVVFRLPTLDVCWCAS